MQEKYECTVEEVMNTDLFASKLTSCIDVSNDDDSCAPKHFWFILMNLVNEDTNLIFNYLLILTNYRIFNTLFTYSFP